MTIVKKGNQFVVAGPIAGLVALAAVAYLLWFSNLRDTISLAMIFSEIFSVPFQKGMCMIGSFAVAMLLAKHVLGREDAKLIQIILFVVLSSVSAVLLSPAFAAFPPLVAFLCRMMCPESIYHPIGRMYKNEGRAVSKDIIQACFAVVSISLLVITTEIELLLNAASQGQPLLGIVSFLIPIALWPAYLMVVKSRKGEVDKATKYLSVSFHCAEKWLWGLLLSFIIFQLAGSL